MKDNIFKDKILKEIKNTFPDFRITILFKHYINEFINTIYEEMIDDYEHYLFVRYAKDNIKKYRPSDFVLMDCAFYLRDVFEKNGELYPKDVSLFFRLKKVIKSDIARFLAEREYWECRKDLMEYVKQHRGE